MKNQGLKLTCACMAVVAFFIILGWTGDYDYCEQIILHMSQEEYDKVKNHLTELNGERPTERQIAHWWADHHHNNR